MQGMMLLLSPAQSTAKARERCRGGQDLLVRGVVQTSIFSHGLDTASPATKSWCRFWANSLCRESKAELSLHLSGPFPRGPSYRSQGGLRPQY